MNAANEDDKWINGVFMVHWTLNGEYTSSGFECLGDFLNGFY